MPNRYEREIEEILRNLETTEPGTGRGQRPRSGERRMRQPPVRQPKRTAPALNFRATEWFLLIALITISVAGGYAYATDGASAITGIIALVGLVCLIFLALSNFVSFSSRSTQSTRYGNVTPLRRNPVSILATRWHLYRLKRRYRRKNEH